MNHLVKWNMVSQMQEDGGLGSGGLENKNLALLAKCGWRFFNEKNSLWVQVIKRAYAEKVNSVGTPKEAMFVAFAVRGLAFQGAGIKWIRWPCLTSAVARE